jgi:hypothetical protein
MPCVTRACRLNRWVPGWGTARSLDFFNDGFCDGKNRRGRRGANHTYVSLREAGSFDDAFGADRNGRDVLRKA